MCTTQICHTHTHTHVQINTNNIQSQVQRVATDFRQIKYGDGGGSSSSTASGGAGDHLGYRDSNSDTLCRPEHLS